MNLHALVCGGRFYADCAWVYDLLDIIGPTRITNGGATGADSFSTAWAILREVPFKVIPVTPNEWFMHGKRAGHLRNTKLLLEKPDIVIAFPGGNGTADMCKQARAAGVWVLEA